jgi:hypothetical protein
MVLKFYMTPGSCSTGIQILLETLELPLEAWIVNIPRAPPGVRQVLAEEGSEPDHRVPVIPDGAMRAAGDSAPIRDLVERVGRLRARLVARGPG